MLTTEIVEVPENAVIVLHTDAPENYEMFLDLAMALHEKFPTSLVVHLSSGDSLTTLPLDLLEEFLRDLIEHRDKLLLYPKGPPPRSWWKWWS